MRQICIRVREEATVFAGSSVRLDKYLHITLKEVMFTTANYIFFISVPVILYFNSVLNLPQTEM